MEKYYYLGTNAESDEFYLIDIDGNKVITDSGYTRDEEFVANYMSVKKSGLILFGKVSNDVELYDENFNEIFNERPNDFSTILESIGLGFNADYLYGYDKNIAYALKSEVTAGDLNIQLITIKKNGALEGANQKYLKTGDLTVRFNGYYDDFEKVLINGKELATSNYTKAKGSTIITLKEDYLKGLEDGDYTLAVQYTRGVVESTSFNVATPVKENKKEETAVDNKETKVDNPKTSDNIIAMVGLSTISLFGFGSLVVSKKKKYN